MQCLPDMDLLTLAPVLQGSKLSVKELAKILPASPFHYERNRRSRLTSGQASRVLRIAQEDSENHAIATGSHPWIETGVGVGPGVITGNGHWNDD
jgi:hypothetical protein